MNMFMENLNLKKIFIITLFTVLLFPFSSAKAENSPTGITETAQPAEPIIRAKKINPTTIELLFTNDHRMLIDFYGDNIFRVFQDNTGGMIRDPEAKPEAQILVNNPRKFHG